MRTTLTLDEDVANDLKHLMQERGTSFKDTVNDLLRRGMHSEVAAVPYQGPTFSSGVQPGVDLDKALSVAGDLEDRELMRKVEMGK